MTGFFGRVAIRESCTKMKTVNYCGLFEQVGREKGGMGNENKEFEYNLKKRWRPYTHKNQQNQNTLNVIFHENT